VNGRRRFRDAGTSFTPLVRPDGLRGRDFLRIAGLSRDELRFMLDMAAEVKSHPTAYTQSLAGQVLALLFEKPSLRTRSTFEIGMLQLGGHAVYMGPQETGLGVRESVPDVARNLERWVDVIAARVFAHKTLVDLARFASVPVISALCELEHPCQAIADFQTMREHLGELEGRSLAWIGDGNNVLHSLMLAAARLDVSVRAAIAEGFDPLPDVVAAARDAGCDLLLTRDPREAVAGADVVYTDTWVSMGQEKEAAVKEPIFAPFQVDTGLMDAAGPDALFMHCLPAKRGKEVTDEVMDGPRSIVFDQAENRLHAQKAVLLALLS